MIDFILGYLFGVHSKSSSELIHQDEIQNSKYVPKFSGYFRNEGTRYNEDWKWIEPKCRRRYLNVYRMKNKEILQGSWGKDKSADECISCKDQRDLEAEVEIKKTIDRFDYEVIYENEYELVYLNVELREDIIISIDKHKKDDSFESIHCLDSEEAEEILEYMKDYYRQYRYVEIIDNVNI